MAKDTYVSIRGAKQGQFKGNGSAKGRGDKWIEVVRYEQTIQAPRDVATGQASGKRRQETIKFRIEMGTASQQLMSALVNDEALLDVNFEFVNTNAAGEEYVYYTIKLTDAHVTRFGTRASDSNSFSGHEKNVHEWSDVELATSKIVSVSYEKSKTFSDQWTTQ